MHWQKGHQFCVLFSTIYNVYNFYPLFKGAQAWEFLARVFYTKRIPIWVCDLGTGNNFFFFFKLTTEFDGFWFFVPHWVRGKKKIWNFPDISVHTLVRDASTKGRILKEPRRSRDPPSPRWSDAPSKGRVIQRTGRPRDASFQWRIIIQVMHSPRKICGFSFRAHWSGRNNIASFSEFLRCAWNRAKAVPATVIQAAHLSFRSLHHLL